MIGESSVLPPCATVDGSDTSGEEVGSAERDVEKGVVVCSRMNEVRRNPLTVEQHDSSTTTIANQMEVLFALKPLIMTIAPCTLLVSFRQKEHPLHDD